MATYFDQSLFQIRCEWGLQAIEHLGRDVLTIVIVDVLSFSTTIDIAVSRGAEILPYPWNDGTGEAFAKDQGAVLARSRKSTSFSLSPRSMLSATPGQRIVLPSPNGSALSVAASRLDVTVIAGCLRNARAVAEYVRQQEGPVLVVPAGERWPDGYLRPCLEDWLGSGAMINYLEGTMSPEAEAARSVFEGFKKRVPQALRVCSSGIELIQRGFPEDVELAAQVNSSEAVPIFGQDAFKRSV